MRLFCILFIFLFSLNAVFGQFGEPKEIIPTISNIRDVKCYDIDNDGDLDILSASFYDNKVAWYENLGGGIFSKQKVIAHNLIGANHVEASDIDNDGDLDILATSWYYVVWFENTSNGSFKNAEIISASQSGPEKVISIDMDNDGDSDIIVCSHSDDKIAWYENVGSTFGTEQLIVSGNCNAYSFDAKDIGNDGDIDILCGCRSENKVSWFENLGNNVFSTEKIITQNAADVENVHFVDIDNDIDLDVVSASFLDSKIAWYENLGGGNIDTNQILISTMASYSHGVNSADIDNDNDMDIIATYSGEVVWYENVGGIIDTNRNIIVAIGYGTGGNGVVVSGDLNNDGNMDVIFSMGASNILGYSLNQGNGIFSGMTKLIDGIPSNPWSIYSADIDNDGDMDVLSASYYGNNINWYENLGGARFDSTILISSIAKGAKDVITSDLDNDGDLDIISASYLDDKIAWYENLGGGNIDTNQNVISITCDGAIAVICTDIDNDNDSDVVVASEFDNTIAWFENLGNGIISTTKNIISNIAGGVKDVNVGDINNDGLVDILAALYSTDKVVWYENLGGGVFGTEIICGNSQNGVHSVYPIDMDFDGDIDLVSASYLGGSVVWRENLGNGLSFNTNMVSSGGILFMDAIAADVDHDSDIDIISAGRVSSSNAPGIVMFHENIGNGFFPQLYKKKFTQPVGANKVFFTDLDGDGDADILSSSYNDNRLLWYENYYTHKFKLIGATFFDANQNQAFDSTELGLTTILLSSQPSSVYSWTDPIGNYQLYGDSGVYIVNYQIAPWWGLTTDSISFTRKLTSLNPVADSLNFGFYPDSIFTLITPSLTGSFPSCNDTSNFWVNVGNSGTTRPNGLVHLALDDSITYVSSVISPDSINGQNLYWHFDSLFFFAKSMFNIEVQMPDFNSMGDTVSSILFVHELDGGNNIIYTNSDTLDQIILCAYDPNDKSVAPAGVGPEGYIANNLDLEYLIRFQNTGNDTAFTVMVRDQLDSNLNWSTLQVIASSHPLQALVELDGEAVFKFHNIMLPDSGANFLGSQGFVKFKIKPDSGLAPNTPIFNTGHIYFDYNPAVITNTVLNTIDTIGSTVSIKEIEFTESKNIIVFPNPFQDNLTIYYKGKIENSYRLVFYDITGKEVYRKENVNTNKATISFNQLAKGLYVVTGTDYFGKQMFNEKVIAQ